MGSCSKNPIYLNNLRDTYLTSNADGTARTYVLTPQSAYGLGLGLISLTAGLRVNADKTANFAISIKLQYSFDGASWTNGNASIIGTTTTAGDTKGQLSNTAEFFPFVRVVAEVVHSTAGATQVGSSVSVWALYRYNT